MQRQNPVWYTCKKRQASSYIPNLVLWFFLVLLRLCTDYRVYMCVHECVNMCACVYVNVCVHECVHVCEYVCECVCVNMCACVCVCMCVCMCMWICVCLGIKPGASYIPGLCSMIEPYPQPILTQLKECREQNARTWKVLLSNWPQDFYTCSNGSLQWLPDSHPVLI